MFRHVICESSVFGRSPQGGDARRKEGGLVRVRARGPESMPSTLPKNNRDARFLGYFLVKTNARIRRGQSLKEGKHQERKSTSSLILARLELGAACQTTPSLTSRDLPFFTDIPLARCPEVWLNCRPSRRRRRCASAPLHVLCGSGEGSGARSLRSDLELSNN